MAEDEPVPEEIPVEEDPPPVLEGVEGEPAEVQEPPPEPEPVVEATAEEAEPVIEEPPGPSEPEPPEPPVSPIPIVPETLLQPSQDALSIEFLYYGSTLKVIAPTLSNDADRELVVPWIRKLFRPEYQSSKLREKRNRYLIALTITILNDEAYGAFQKPPSDGPLQELSTIKVDPSPAAEWELDPMWQETLLALPDDFVPMDCSIHHTPEECKADHNLDKILDQEFQFLLYLTRPYAALLSPEDRTRIAAWLQTLCTIHGNSCSSMKAIRNDYLMSLLGYLADLRIVGPFIEYPPPQLKPLHEAVGCGKRPVTDPTTPAVQDFLMDQPVPDEGAFCYVALTGDLVASSL